VVAPPPAAVPTSAGADDDVDSEEELLKKRVRGEESEAIGVAEAVRDRRAGRIRCAGERR